HGAGAKQLVPVDRPQPADIRRKHLRREGFGLHRTDASRIPIGDQPFLRAGLSDQPGSEMMMAKALHRTLVATALLAGIASLGEPQRAPDWAAVDRYVAQAARDWHVPALAIAVVKDGELVFARGYGVLETGKNQRADEHTRFAIGSTTKAMTSAGLAMLVD